MQIVKTREVKNLNLFTRHKIMIYVYDNRVKILPCNIGSQSSLSQSMQFLQPSSIKAVRSVLLILVF